MQLDSIELNSLAIEFQTAWNKMKWIKEIEWEREKAKMLWFPHL